MNGASSIDTEIFAPRVLADILRYWAARQPDRPALMDAMVTQTYGALAARVERIGRSLAALGLGRESRVALASQSPLATVQGIIAIASHATCAPLDPALSAASLQEFFERIQLRAVFTDDAGTPAAQAGRALGLPVLDLDGDASPGDGQPLPWRAAQPEDVALILLSSGTTKRPKIVPRTHRNLLFAAVRDAGCLRLSAADAGVSLMPAFHAHGVHVAMASLFSGGSMACLGRLDTEALGRVVERHRPTWFSASPTVHAALLSAEEAGQLRLHGWRPRVIRAGSGPISEQLIRQIEQRFDTPVVYNFGLTEAGNVAIRPLPPIPSPAGSSGRVQPGEMVMLDPQGQVLPQGQTGVIAVRSPAVSPGYIDDEAASEAAFAGGWFRTGDLGFIDAEGFLFFVGRTSDIIHRGAAKVAPHEVEAWLTAQPGVALAAVFAVPHAALGEDVAAAIVPVAGALAPDPRALRMAMLEAMPGYKVPSRIAVVQALPLGPAGKVRRAGLAQALADCLNSAFRAPATMEEQRATDAFAAALGMAAAEIGLDDDFFSLGGHSLLAVQMLAQMRWAGGPVMTPAAFMRDPTPAGLSLLLAGGGAAAGARIWPAGIEAYRDGGERAPLFFMPGLEGHPHVARGLLAYLPAEVPLLGVASPPGWYEAADPIGVLAAHCAEVLRAAQPTGPYRLAGHSYGGCVAQATARLLVQAGAEVALLCLLDPNPALVAPMQGGEVPAGAHMHGWEVYPGRAVLLRSWERPLRQLAMPGLGWEHLCAGGVEVYDLATTHWGIMTLPHMARVGEILAGLLDSEDGVGPDGSAAAWPRADVHLPFMRLPDALMRARVLLSAGRPAEAWEALLASPPASLPAWAWDLAEVALMGAVPQQERAAMMQRLGYGFACLSESTACRVPREMRAGRHAAALSMLRRASPLGMRPETFALAEAICVNHMGRPDQAQAALAQFETRIMPEPDMAAVAWFELIEGGLLAASTPFGARGIAAGSNAARAWIYGVLAHVAAARQDWAGVAMEAGAAAAAWPGFFNYHQMLVYALVRLGRHEEARQRHAEACAGLAPDANARRNLDRALAG